MSGGSLVARARSALAAALGAASERLGWNQIYRTVSYVRSALWVVPIVSVLLALVVISALQMLDRFVTWDLTGLRVT